MIASKLISGTAVPEFDFAVSDMLEDSALEGGGKDMEIAIENPEGKLYRVLTTTGMGAFMHVTQSRPFSH